MKRNYWPLAAGLSGFIAVAFAAIAAHALSTPHSKELAEKAAQYQLIHAVVILCVANWKGKISFYARFAFLFATLFFCGGLYLSAFTGLDFFTNVAPLGGVLFMTGWLLIAFSCFQKGEDYI